MLSRQLISLFKTLRPYADTGVHISSERMFAILSILQDAIDEAEALEAKDAPRMGDALGGEFPENVVRFDAPRDGAEIAQFIPRPRNPGPEDAA